MTWCHLPPTRPAERPAKTPSFCACWKHSHFIEDTKQEKRVLPVYTVQLHLRGVFGRFQSCLETPCQACLPKSMWHCGWRRELLSPRTAIRADRGDVTLRTRPITSRAVNVTTPVTTSLYAPSRLFWGTLPSTHPRPDTMSVRKRKDHPDDVLPIFHAIQGKPGKGANRPVSL